MTKNTIPISTIKPRASSDTRPLDPGHVVALAESIAALGLIEPVAIDSQHRLLAGAHRLAACRLVAIADITQRLALFGKLFPSLPSAKQTELAARVAAIDRSGWLERHTKNLIPVRFVRIDSDKDNDAALAIEVAENEKRRDYSVEEVQSLAKRLLKAGYTERQGGRPRAGERALRPMIASVIGKSERQVRRLLQGRRGDTRPHGRVSRKPARPRRQVRSWEKAVAGLKRALGNCRTIGKRRRSARILLSLLERVEQALPVA